MKTFAGSLKHHNYAPLFLLFFPLISINQQFITQTLFKYTKQKYKRQFGGGGGAEGVTVCGLRINTSRKEDLRVTSTQISMK